MISKHKLKLCQLTLVVFVVVFDLNFHDSSLLQHIDLKIETLVSAAALPRLLESKNALYL